MEYGEIFKYKHPYVEKFKQNSGLSGKAVPVGATRAPSPVPIRANNAHVSPEWGNPDDPGFASKYLTPIKIPGTDKDLMVHKNSAQAFGGFLQELKDKGYPLGDVQSYNNRNERGGSMKSQHAWGNAIDINPGKNRFRTSDNDFARYGIDIHALANEYGLMRGGDFIKSKDPMHFENANPVGSDPGTAVASSGALVGGSTGTAPSGMAGVTISGQLPFSKTSSRTGKASTGQQGQSVEEQLKAALEKEKEDKADEIDPSKVQVTPAQNLMATQAQNFRQAMSGRKSFKDVLSSLG
jgi:hypothetical protein